MDRSIPFLPLVAFALCVNIVGAAWERAAAGVIQQVEATYVPGNGDPEVSDVDMVFEIASGDIDTDVLASVGQVPPGGPGYAATVSAGRFGQVGLDLRNFGVPPGSRLIGSLLVASDEFVNVHGVPATVRTQFIIDGGQLVDLFSRNSSIRFTLQVGAENRGPVDAIDDAFEMELAGALAANLGSAGGFFPGFDGGGYEATLATDAAGNRTFTASGSGALNLNAAYDGNTRVEIPLSLQTLELGKLNPGDRLLVGYHLIMEIEQSGISEGMFAGFSDPFMLMGEPNPILSGNVIIVPVPEPASFVCFGLALLALGAAQVMCRKPVRAQTRISCTTRPWTSVRRNSRPA